MKRIFIMLIVAMLSFSVDAQNLSTKEVSEAYAASKSFTGRWRPPFPKC